MQVAKRSGMANVSGFKDKEEREISRGGKGTALWTLGLAVVLIAGGVMLAIGLRRHAPPPQRPGTTSATNTAGEAMPPSP
jgi:hypothetical protein